MLCQLGKSLRGRNRGVPQSNGPTLYDDRLSPVAEARGGPVVVCAGGVFLAAQPVSAVSLFPPQNVLGEPLLRLKAGQATQVVASKAAANTKRIACTC
jgi:hypothetical protein